MKRPLFSLFILPALSLFLSCAKQDYTEKTDSLIDKYLHAWNTGNLSDLNNVVDSSFELRKPPDFEPVRGIEYLKEYILGTRSVIPDFFLKESGKLFVSDTAVILTWTFKGTYKGENDLPPAGNSIRIPGFSIIYFNANKLTGEWISFSDLTWIRQLGYDISMPAKKL